MQDTCLLDMDYGFLQLKVALYCLARRLPDQLLVQVAICCFCRCTSH